MKKARLSRLWTLGLAVLLLTACTVTSVDESDASTRTPIPSTAATTATAATSSGTTSQPDTLPETVVTTEGDAPSDLPETGFYQWNPYVFDLLSGENQHSAELLADAILSYERLVTLDEGQAQVVCDNIAFEFPPAALVDLTVVGDSVQITYLSDQATHESKLAEFETAVERALNSTLEPEDSESVRALLLYEYVVNNVRYFTVDYTEKDITAFSALTKGVTICYGYADAFGYLLRQTGMEAHLYRGARSDGAVHGWCYAKVDGKWYHFDPTWECSNQKNMGRRGLWYFAMDDARRYQTLLKTADCGFGELLHEGETTGAAEALIEPKLYPCYDWAFDREMGELTCKGGSFKLN